MDSFNHKYIAAADINVGLKRSSNQDEVVFCPDLGFFAVSDGMGGLYGGGATSTLIAKTLPGFIRVSYEDLVKEPTPEKAAELLSDAVKLLSDNIYDTLNFHDSINYGATLCGVWLVDSHAVFVNIGDSRGYIFNPKANKLTQITHDHNVADMLIKLGMLTKEGAKNHPSVSSLTRFVGMNSPAQPETFIEKINVDDRILLCSDWLHGMVGDQRLAKLLHSGKSPERMVKRLIKEANSSGGRDNISAVYVRVLNA
jgi:serine/threonine protein phosphatase PrpC